MQGVEWGKMNMIEAECRLLANALLDISNQRFVFLSESCIPLFNFTTIYSYLINSTKNFVDTKVLPRSVSRGRDGSQWRKGSQWFEMDRDLAIKIISDKKYFPLYQNYYKHLCCADEHYLPTFVSIMFWEKNSNRSLTQVDWSRGGIHPATFMRADVTMEFLEKMRSERKCEYNGHTTSVCFLFARKFSPHALDRLLRVAPKVMQFKNEVYKSLDLRLTLNLRRRIANRSTNTPRMF
ncbi:glycosyltransferase BC10-like [Cornus florida]|uniref:glycosyltransferase BC10-like n=1 Tax=Cornus florida TaxID=4283 RepID=UPI00289CD204|nr:glycosyltransferase BC10-like [Cornus florida]